MPPHSNRTGHNAERTGVLSRNGRSVKACECTAELGVTLQTPRAVVRIVNARDNLQCDKTPYGGYWAFAVSARKRRNRLRHDSQQSQLTNPFVERASKQIAHANTVLYISEGAVTQVLFCYAICVWTIHNKYMFTLLLRAAKSNKDFAAHTTRCLIQPILKHRMSKSLKVCQLRPLAYARFINAHSNRKF